MILLVQLCAGIFIGLFYFGGLWLTLDKMTECGRWGLWLVASFLLRSTMVVFAFWLLAGGDWRRILALAAGFTLVRLLAVKQIQLRPVPSL